MVYKTKEYFEKAFQKQMKFIKRFRRSNIGYGEDVMPILELYANLTTYDERMFFTKTLEDFLSSSDKEKRNFAINVCLGFFIFQDAIGK